VRAGLLLRVAAAFRAVTVTPVPACHGIALLANVPDRQRRDGRLERVIRREAWRFSSHRMGMDYARACYVPAAGGVSCDMTNH